MGLMLFWTTHKQKQAMAAMKLKQEQQRIDSLANVAKNGGLKLTDPQKGLEKAAIGEATIGQAADSGASTPSAQTSAIPMDTIAQVLVPHRFLNVETNRFKVRLDNEGAKIASLSLKDLAGKPPYNATILPDNGGALALKIDKQDLDKTLWEFDARDSTLSVLGAPVKVSFKTTLPGTKTILKRTFTFYPE